MYVITGATGNIGKGISQILLSSGVQAGISPDVARSYIEMEQAINDGKISPVKRTPENTTPTSLETFSDTFAAAYGRS